MSTQTLSKNPLRQLEAFGQSIWLDYIRRDMLQSGELKRLVEEDGLSGVTSNPAIFQKAMESTDYDDTIASLAKAGKSPSEIYRAVVIADIQSAAEILAPVYAATQTRDGYISLEVAPEDALDTTKTLTEARELWKAVDRPNLLIKVPGTQAGLPAIRQLISEGINVNVTLLFGLNRYREVAEAYIKGLEERSQAGLPLQNIASVASFFLSRIDTLIDPMLDKFPPDSPQYQTAQSLKGEIAIASAKGAYEIYQELFEGDRFKALADQGAQPQRLLWASTSSKNPAYSDVKYVEALIGPNTVNTVPRETLDAYRDHGQPAVRLMDDMPKAQDQLKQLADLGITLDQLTAQLETEGIQKFQEPFDKLMAAITEKQQKAANP